MQAEWFPPNGSWSAHAANPNDEEIAVMNELSFRGVEEIEYERERGEESECELEVVRDEEGRCREITFDGALRIRF